MIMIIFFSAEIDFLVQYYTFTYRKRRHEYSLF